MPSQFFLLLQWYQYPHGGIGHGKWHFLVEKMGLSMFHLRGDEELDGEEGNEGEGGER